MHMGNTKKRLTFYITGLAKGGAHQSAIAWFELLRASGEFELDVHVGIEGWFTDQLKSRGIPYRYLPLPAALGAIKHGSWKNRWTTLRRVAAMVPALALTWAKVAFRKTDGVVLTSGRDFLMLLPLVLRKRKCSATIPQSTDWGDIPSCKAMCQIVREVFAISQSVADSIVAMGIEPAKVKVLPLIFTKPREQKFPARQELRLQLGLPVDRPIVGIVGLVRSNKGQQDAVQVMDRIRREIPDALLVVAGAAMADQPAALAYEAETKEMVKRLGLENNVRFLGWRDDVPAVMRSFDVLYVPSHDREGVPRVILEGLEAALPLVATNIDQFCEVIGTYDAGVLLPVTDHDGWARETVRLLKDPAAREELSGKALAAWRSHYSEEAVKPVLLAAFGSLAP